MLENLPELPKWIGGGFVTGLAYVAYHFWAKFKDSQTKVLEITTDSAQKTAAQEVTTFEAATAAQNAIIATLNEQLEKEKHEVESARKECDECRNAHHIERTAWLDEKSKLLDSHRVERDALVDEQQNERDGWLDEKRAMLNELRELHIEQVKLKQVVAQTEYFTELGELRLDKLEEFVKRLKEERAHEVDHRIY